MRYCRLRGILTTDSFGFIWTLTPRTITSSLSVGWLILAAGGVQVQIELAFRRLTIRKNKEPTVPARAEPRGEGPAGPAGVPGGGGLDSGIVPLPGDRGHVAEVTAQPLNALTALCVRPVKLSVTDRWRRAEEGFFFSQFGATGQILKMHLNLTSSTGRSSAVTPPAVQ